MGKNRPKKQKNPKSVPKFKKKKKINLTKPIPSSDSCSSDPEIQIQTLLEPLSKDQLIDLVTDLSLSHSSLLTLFESHADRDVTHRKIFVHGLGWDATRSSLESTFSTFGEIEGLHVVTDRTTVKCKGYAFLTFKTRKSATKLLKNPRIQVGTRLTFCQLASAGPAAPSAGSVVSHQNVSTDFPQRKIYVSNVPANTTVEKLRSFFEKFGEMESGPTGLDPTTGKFKGYAIFVYKTVEGAKKALEDPNKAFEGTVLNCRKANVDKGKTPGGAASITTALQPVGPQMIEAVTAAQNMALIGQQMGLGNPMTMYGNANLGALMGGYYGQLPGLGFGAYGFSGAGAYGLLSGAGAGAGAYGLGGAGAYGIGGLSAVVASDDGWQQHMYPPQNGQASLSLPKTSGMEGSGYCSNL